MFAHQKWHTICCGKGAGECANREERSAICEVPLLEQAAGWGRGQPVQEWQSTTLSQGWGGLKAENNSFSKLSVHDGEEEEGGCPLPEWKPCGCREKARRRQVLFVSHPLSPHPFPSYPTPSHLSLFVFFASSPLSPFSLLTRIHSHLPFPFLLFHAFSLFLSPISFYKEPRCLCPKRKCLSRSQQPGHLWFWELVGILSANCCDLINLVFMPCLMSIDVFSCPTPCKQFTEEWGV